MRLMWDFKLPQANLGGKAQILLLCNKSLLNNLFTCLMNAA
jgi:hypothetical protein